MRQIVVFVISCSLLWGIGCEKKKPTGTASVTGPRTAPTLTEPLPAGLPDQGTIPVETAKTEPPPSPAKTVTKPKPRTRPHKPTNTQAPPATANGTATQPAIEAPAANTTVASAKPPKNPVDAAAEAAISADLTATQAANERDKANRDLDTAENELKSLDGRNLSSDEQSIVSQVKSYISQSRKALSEGDYERAANLANKAKLLTDALKKM